MVALNNVSREHIDTHGSFEKYVKIKSSLITETSEKSFAILNLDNPYSAALVNKTRAKVVSFGIENENGHIHCKHLDLTTGRAKFTVEILKPIRSDVMEYEPSEFRVELGVPGLHFCI